MTSQNSDSDAKICPFMSGPGSDPCEGEYTHHAECIGEKCAAWIPACDIYMDPIHERGKTMQECPAFEYDCQEHRPYCAGYCALIFQQRRRS